MLTYFHLLIGLIMVFIILIQFFLDLAASNKYDIIKISLANRDGAELKLEGDNLSILFEQIKPNRNNFKI